MVDMAGLESPRRSLLTAGLLLALAAAVAGYLGWRHSVQVRPPREIQAFWDRFLATNTAWLDPHPPAMTYEIVLQQQDLDSGRLSWRDQGVLSTWCTPEKNLRLLEKATNRATGALVDHDEHRYFHGRGNRVRLKSEGRLRELGLDQWLAGRTGGGFLSSLHLLAAWGLPAPVRLNAQPDGTLQLIVTNLNSLPRQWRKDVMIGPAYGVHPAVFSSEAEFRPNAVEVGVDAATLKPTTLIERDAGGRTEVRVTFGPWLTVQGRPVPGAMECELPTRKEQVRYEFASEQGVWLLKEMVHTNTEAYSLCRRSFTRNLRLGPLADSFFPNPADLEIPEHSVTTLAPGERLMSVRTDDGLTLEAKLSLPPRATAAVPVVFFLPGAGPWSFDRPVLVPDLSRTNEPLAATRVVNYCDFFAHQLTARGIGFFRANKRGCGIVKDELGQPREIANRSLFSRATPSVLLADYQAALRTLRQQAGVDAQRIVLLGGSEGTRLAPRLALAQPAGVVAVVLCGYSEHGTKDTILWQHTVGPWRNIARIFDANNDQKVTRQEYEEAVRRVGKRLSEGLPFANLDRDKDGLITPSDLNQAAAAHAILKAALNRDEDYLWDNVANLSSAYLLEEWECPPTHKTLLQLDLPLAIFHGEDDGSCRVEGVREAQAALQRAGKRNLTVKIYPKTDHDLNWTRFLRDGNTPVAFEDLFAYITQQLQHARRDETGGR